MKKRIIFLTIIMLIVVMVVGGMHMNKKAIDDAYNCAISLIESGSYEDALAALEKANPNILDRDEFESDMKYGGISGTYKNTIPLYAYSLAKIKYTSKDKYMHTVNDYLGFIPADYSGEMSKEIQTFRLEFKPQYDEYIAEEQRKAEEERIKRIQEEEQRIRNSVPYVGMSESRINDTILGTNYESFHNYDMKGGKRIEATVYRFKKGNAIIYVARCIGGRVDTVSDYRDDPWVTGSSTSSSSSGKKKVYNDDSYNVNDYYDAEDFYEDYYDDFYDYEDAEDYYNEHYDD